MRLKSLLLITAAVAIAAPASAQDFAVEEIVVTSRKREENLFEIPISVTNFSAEQLQAANIGNVKDLSDYTPGFVFEFAAGSGGRVNNPEPRFRGVRNQQTTPVKQISALFWDGSFLGYGASIIPFYDLERVEVLKGPQTAYFGRNTFTGAVNFIPAEPGDEFEGQAELSYSPSHNDSYLVSVGAGGPITDKIGLRVNMAHEREGGDFKYGDGTDFGRVDRTSVTGTLTFEPFEDLRLKLNGYYVDGDDTYQSLAVNWTSAAGACNKTVSGNFIDVVTGERTPFTRDLSTLTVGSFCGVFPRGDNMQTPAVQVPTADTSLLGALFLGAVNDQNALLEKYGIIPKMPGGFGGAFRTKRFQFSGEYDLPADHTLEFTTSVATTGVIDTFDLFFGAGPAGLVFPVGNTNYMRELNYEGRLISPQDGRLRYLIGVNNYSQRYRNGQHGTNNSVNFENNQTFSIYGSVDYDITEQLTLSVEARYLDDETFVILNGSPTATNPLTFTANEENSIDEFIPRVILTYQPLDGTTVYGSFSASSLIGVQTNARRISALDPITIPDPTQLGDFTPKQTNDAWELGWKQQYDRVQFTIAAYHMKWKNQVFNTTVLAGNQTSSFGTAGSSKYNGIDIEVLANPTDWLDIQGGLTFNDAELIEFASRGSFDQVIFGSGFLATDNTGNRPGQVPKWSGSLSATVHGDVMDRAWFLRGDMLYEGSMFMDNSEFNKNKGAARINLRAGIDLVDDTAIEAYVTNVTNNKRLPAGATTNGVGGRKTFGPPYEKRRFGVRLLANF